MSQSKIFKTLNCNAFTLRTLYKFILYSETITTGYFLKIVFIVQSRSHREIFPLADHQLYNDLLSKLFVCSNGAITPKDELCACFSNYKIPQPQVNT